MIQTDYFPEGMLMKNAENREYTSSLQGLEKAMAQGKILEGTAVKCDGDFCLHVELPGGVRGIIPRSEAAWERSSQGIKDIAVITRVGKPVCFKIMEIRKNKSGLPELILSRREAQRECYECFLSHLSPGDIVDSKVTHLEHFGAFVDIGCGIVSLLSIDCISVSRISHPKDRFYLGQYIKTVIKSIENETGRIYVTHKELLGTWLENAALFKAGQTVAGKIRSVEPYGVFVELTPNLAGLAEYRDDVLPNQTAAVYIKSIIPERMKVKLVLIDSCKSDLSPLHESFVPEKINSDHISYWRYSPDVCDRKIETFFD